ncbi:hypothetical protein [Streptomyces sp. H39-S7]|uniref:hypothetical protein n=1 Tax=Streptomyces sp. H39-S7 TaxID=3004357 RepID=UPI0022AEB0D2|nr:hypothetical protein [Streptomyces sp. H39-S7]MCZ4119056.1 hypothetical protein [Streptomyces sp. H39-S7]
MITSILARFGYAKTDPQQSRCVEAAAAFVESWAYLGPSLPDDYECTLNCEEAETLAALFDAFGYVTTAEAIIDRHSEYDCDCEDSHHSPCDYCRTATEEITV